jgi:hypothetical protein
MGNGIWRAEWLEMIRLQIDAAPPPLAVGRRFAICAWLPVGTGGRRKDQAIAVLRRRVRPGFDDVADFRSISPQRFQAFARFRRRAVLARSPRGRRRALRFFLRHGVVSV